MSEICDICYSIPKAELHIHIEGSFEPELIFKIAKRNNIIIPYNDIYELKEKYKFNNLQEFLDIYYVACSVLICEEDFSELMYEYLKKSYQKLYKFCFQKSRLRYAEIFFDPQSHTSRGINMRTIIEGLKKGINLGKKEFNIESNLHMCFLRHLSEEECINIFYESLEFREDILSIGLDSSEIGNPPQKFIELYKLAKEKGFRLSAHGGEEGDNTYIEGCIDYLKVERIDHGIQSYKYDNLIKRISELKIPLTLCPLSNQKLKVIPDLSYYPLRFFIENNVIITINSDDPAYFGGYIGDNYFALKKILNLSINEIILLAKNSFIASFLSDEKKDYYLKLIDDHISYLNNI